MGHGRWDREEGGSVQGSERIGKENGVRGQGQGKVDRQGREGIDPEKRMVETDKEDIEDGRGASKRVSRRTPSSGRARDEIIRKE